MPIQITPSQAPELLTDVFRAGKVPMIVASPGIGKSNIYQQVADVQNLLLVDIRLAQCDPTDLNGFPALNKETGKASYFPMEMFPVEGDELPQKADGTYYAGWLLLFDEITSASMAVQAASYKIMLDKKIGQLNLHPKVAIGAAGNLMSDKAIVNKISTALQSRMIHFELIVSFDDFIDWAHTNKIDHRILSFLGWRKDLLHKFDPDHNDKTFACPRTWEFLSDIIKPWKEITVNKLPVIAGTVSEGVAREFLGFSQIFESLPSIKDILNRPDTFTLPDNEPSILYAISGLIANSTSVDNIATLMKAIVRLPIEFQVICLKGSLKRTPTLAADQSVRHWITQNAQDLL